MRKWIQPQRGCGECRAGWTDGNGRNRVAVGDFLRTLIPHGLRQFDPKRPPSLLHTRVRGEFGVTPFSNWNDMLRIAHIRAFKEAGAFEELRKMTRAQIRKGAYSDEGYRFVPEIGVSIQGVDANHAWEYALRLAIHLKVPLKAEIEWRHNDKAAHPGERGIMVWTS
jgi:hypothetical protein